MNRMKDSKKMNVSLYAYSRAGTQRENVFYLQSVNLF